METSAKYSDRAMFPADMIQVNPPRGTITYEAGIDREKLTEVNRFGVRWMGHGLIRTFKEPRGSGADYQEGTLIEFMPGQLNVHVARRGLAAGEINKIGNLSAEIDNSLNVSRTIPEALRVGNDLIEKLSVINISRISHGDHQGAKLDKTVADLGLLMGQLKESKSAEHKKYIAMVEEAYALGVTLITSHTDENLVPVTLIVKELETNPQE